MKRNMFIAVLRSVFVSVIILASLTVLHAQKYSGSPVTKDRLVRAVRSKQFAVPTLVKQIKISGVDFVLTQAVENELNSVNAHQQVIDAVRSNYRYAGHGSGKVGPAAPPRDLAGERYETLYYQGLDALNRLRTAASIPEATNISRTVIDLGSQAIKADPARYEAYALVGSAHLVMRNFAEAERYGQSAIDRGGSLAFPVYHLAGTPHLEVLHIGSGFVTVESNQKFFQFGAQEISNLQRENNYAMGGIMVAVFSMTTQKGGRTDLWYFAPGNTGTPDEAAMIMRLIRKNSIG